MMRNEPVVRKGSIFIFLVLSVLVLTAQEILPEAKIYDRPVSRSRWLWNSDEKVSKGAKSYFRYEFDLPGKVLDAKFNVKCDDSGEFYLNGEKITPDQIGKKLIPGKNLLAVQVTNGFGGAGLLLYGAVELDSGSVVYLHSTSDIKAAAHQAEGWEKPGFDDSAWKNALDQGDVLSQPWSKWYDYTEEFTSPEERVKIRESEENAITISPEIAETPAPDAKIVYDGSSPKISVNGRLYDPFLNVRGEFDEMNSSFAVKAAGLGIKIVQVFNQDLFSYKGNGRHDFTGLDHRARRILHLIPDGQLIVSLSFGKSSIWMQENPGENIEYADGPVQGPDSDELWTRVLRPSAASEKFRAYVRDYMADCARYIRSQPWGNRVIGVRIVYGIYSEWHPFGMYHGPDVGPCMTENFRSWLKEKYGTEENLRKAWNDPAVTFASATAPTMEERSPEGALLDPVRDRKTMDYFDCFTAVNADLLLMAAGVIRKELPGRLCGAYYGYVFSTHPPEGSNILLDKVLSSGVIDYCSNPAPYTGYSRLAGGSFPNRTIPATFRRYGKLAIVEDDSRFHQFPQLTEPAISTKTPLESQMVARRNICNTIFDECGLQIHDPSPGNNRLHTFDDPAVLQGIKEGLEAVKKAGRPEDVSGNSCAVVVDYRERLHVSRSKQGRPLLNGIYLTACPSLDRSGIPYDLMSLQDFLKTEQNYSTVVFLNLFSLPEAERKAVREKIRKPGVTAVWLAAPGSVTDNGFSDEAMSELTGLKLAGSGAMPAVRSADPEAKELAGGAVLKSLADGSRAVFSASVPKTGTQWQNLLTALGVHAYTAPESYFRRHGNIFMFHTGEKGAHTITLPEKSGTVTELFTGKQYEAPVIRVESEGPGTWLFRIQGETGMSHQDEQATAEMAIYRETINL